MHSSRFQYNPNSCYTCGPHGMGCGRSSCGRGPPFEEMRFGDERGGRGPFDGHHGHHTRGGARYGWGRDGRIRLDDLPIPHRRQGLMAVPTSGLGDLNLGDSGGGNGGGGLLGGRMHRGPFGPRPYGASPQQERGMNDGLLDPREPICLRRELGLGMGPRDRFDMGRPYMPGEIGLIGPTGSRPRGSRPPSIFSASNYSLGHLDRRPRPYHYQPPYVEDYESVSDEELLRQELIEQWGRSQDMTHGTDLYGPLPFGYDIDELRERRGRL